MIAFALRTRAFIDNSIQDFGTSEQQSIWQQWSEANPQVRRTVFDPNDDGSGPMPDTLRALILDTLRKRYEHLMKLIRSPSLSQNDAVTLSGDMGTLYAIARFISGSKLGWLSELGT